MKRATVSVGIPSFNEKKTIKQLLEAVLTQSQKTYRLEKIYVILDGTTDGTEEIVSSMKNKHIVPIAHKRQLGKASRLNELFKLNKSEILVIFDADIQLEDHNVMEAMIQPFADNSISLVSANNQPIEPDEFIGKIWFAAEKMWYEIRKYADNSKTLYNNSGCCIAIKKEIATSIRLPKDTIADQQFIYIHNLKQNGGFYFEKNAHVYYHPPSTYTDILIQYKRSLGESVFFNKYFGRKYDSYLTLSSNIKRRGLVDALKKNPFYTILAIALLKALSTFYRNTLVKSTRGKWAVTESTKKPILI